MIRPKIRLATDDEGAKIAEILAAAGEPDIEELDWSRVWPHWLLAEHRGVRCACINILPGRPVGYIGSLAVLPVYQHEGIGAYLCLAAEQMLRSSGCSGSVFTTKHPQLIDRLTKRGAYSEPGYHVMFKPIRKRVAVDVKSESTETS
jgi:N-acetylglutamate synthase-like GNAT family acetyltransferase